MFKVEKVLFFARTDMSDPLLCRIHLGAVLSNGDKEFTVKGQADYEDTGRYAIDKPMEEALKKLLDDVLNKVQNG